MKNHYVKVATAGGAATTASLEATNEGELITWDEFLDVLAVVVALSFLLVSCVIFS